MSKLRKITKKELANILEQHVLWLNSNKLRGARANLRSANLVSADLSSADLRYADLSSADLHSADLSSANLSSADLCSANLRFANLDFADLRFADLRFADLRSADLRSADLRHANLRSANLRLADLHSVVPQNPKGISLACFPVFYWTAILYSSGQLYIGCTDFDMHDVNLRTVLLETYENATDEKLDDETANKAIDRIFSMYEALQEH